MKNKLFLLALSFCFVGTFAQSQKCNKTIEASDSIEVINVNDVNTYCVTKNITVKEIKLNGGNLLINEDVTVLHTGTFTGRKDKVTNVLIYGKLETRNLVMNQLLATFQLFGKGTMAFVNAPTKEVAKEVDATYSPSRIYPF